MPVRTDYAALMADGKLPKTGPFFDYYGSNHAAGYMVAQAWQVSRIIDVLEKNPGILDPQHFGVTGCSATGKAPSRAVSSTTALR